MCIQFFIRNPFYPPLRPGYHCLYKPCRLPLHNIASFVISVVYSVGYPIIYPLIRAIFAKECGVERLEARPYLLDYPYKIKVILAVRVQGNKAACNFYI